VIVTIVLTRKPEIYFELGTKQCNSALTMAKYGIQWMRILENLIWLKHVNIWKMRMNQVPSVLA